MSIERWDFGTISCPVPYKFEIGRCGGRGANRNGGCEFGIEIFEIGPRGWRGKKLFGRRHHSRDSSRWKNFNWPFTVGTKIGFHRWWPGRIIPRLPWTPRNKRFNGQSFGHWTGKWLLFVTVTESIIYKRSTNRFAPSALAAFRDTDLSFVVARWSIIFVHNCSSWHPNGTKFQTPPLVSPFLCDLSLRLSATFILRSVDKRKYSRNISEFSIERNYFPLEIIVFKSTDVLQYFIIEKDNTPI